MDERDEFSPVNSESKCVSTVVEGRHPVYLGESVETLSRVHIGYLVEGCVLV